jgi:hypothetical protein
MRNGKICLTESKGRTFSVCSVSSNTTVLGWLAYDSCSMLQTVKGGGPETDGMLEDFEIVSQIRSVETIVLTLHR